MIDTVVKFIENNGPYVCFAIFVLATWFYGWRRRLEDKKYFEDLEAAAQVGKPLYCDQCGEDLTRVSSVRVSGGQWLCMKCFSAKEATK